MMCSLLVHHYSWCISMSVSFFTQYCGLRIVAGEVFSGKKLECGYLNTNLLIKTWVFIRVWVICMFWQDFCRQKIPRSLSGFCLKPSHCEMLICNVQDPSWIYALEISLLHLSCVSEHRTQIGFPSHVLRLHLCLTFIIV